MGQDCTNYRPTYQCIVRLYCWFGDGGWLEIRILHRAREEPYCHARGDCYRNAEAMLASNDEPADPFCFFLYQRYHLNLCSIEDVANTFKLLNCPDWHVLMDERKHSISTRMHERHPMCGDKMLQDRSYIASVNELIIVRLLSTDAWLFANWFSDCRRSFLRLVIRLGLRFARITASCLSTYVCGDILSSSFR